MQILGLFASYDPVWVILMTFSDRKMSQEFPTASLNITYRSIRSRNPNSGRSSVVSEQWHGRGEGGGGVSYVLGFAPPSRDFSGGKFCRCRLCKSVSFGWDFRPRSQVCSIRMQKGRIRTWKSHVGVGHTQITQYALKVSDLKCWRWTLYRRRKTRLCVITRRWALDHY